MVIFVLAADYPFRTLLHGRFCANCTISGIEADPVSAPVQPARHALGCLYNISLEFCDLYQARLARRIHAMFPHHPSAG
ncbi:MAG: hypothetical protein V1796_08910 [Pseudomonadota bacterium]